jgi:glutathione S-transferase
VCGIEVEERSVKIARKEQQSQQYLAVNPLGKLPCLQVLTSFTL